MEHESQKIFAEDKSDMNILKQLVMHQKVGWHQIDKEL